MNNFEVLVKRAQQGDMSAVQEIIEAFEPLIFSLFTSEHNVRIKEDVRSICNVAIIEAIEKFTDQDFTCFPGYIKSYLNLQLNNARKKRYRLDWQEAQLVLDDDTPTPEGLILAAFYQQKIQSIDLANAIGQLETMQKFILHFRYYWELSFVTIAKKLHLTCSTAKYYHNLALFKLRNKLKENYQNI